MAVETYIIPLEVSNKYLIYKPLKRLVVVADQTFVDDLQQRLNLAENSAFNLESALVLPPLENQGYITLFLTSECNLKCKYCYVGEKLKTDKMSWEIAQAALDFVYNGEFMNIGFHGGGEQTLEIEMMQKVVNYVNEKLKPKKSSFSIRTNGLFSKQVLNFLSDTNMYTEFSFDGTPEIQTQQRSTNQQTEKIIQNMISANETGILRGIYSTITEYSVNKMVDAIEFLHKNNFKFISFGPNVYIGSSIITKVHPPDPKDFVTNFIKAHKLASEYEIKCKYSGPSIFELQNFGCGACTSNLFITPKGGLSSCLEITSEDSNSAEAFMYGHYNPIHKTFDIDLDKRRNLLSRMVDNLEDCNDCFVKRHCAGGCPSRAYETTGTLLKPDTERCYINREISKYFLMREAGIC